MVSRQLKAGGADILYDAELGREPKPHWFVPIYWAEADMLCHRAGGRGSVMVVDPRRALGSSEPVGRWVLRHYHRGGWAARISDDSYFFTGAEKTRPFREWRLLATLHEQGFPVPKPVAARFRRYGLLYSADLITWEIPDSVPLSEAMQRSGADSVDWSGLGRLLKRFHLHGVFHADLNAHNLLLDPEGGFHLIDFDRGAIKPTGPWPEQNLARLRRSLDKLQTEDPARGFRDEHWETLRAAYRGSRAQ